MAIDWNKFEDWLRQSHTPRFSRDMIIYAKRYLHYLQSGNLGEIGLMSHGKRIMIMTAFSNFCKFLGVYEDWKRLVDFCNALEAATATLKHSLKQLEKQQGNQQLLDKIGLPDTLKQLLKAEAKENMLILTPKRT